MDKYSHLPCLKTQRGQSLVELGISMVVLLFLLAGAINFGIAFFDYVAIRDAAQEGALYGSINPTGNITGRVQNSSRAPVNLSTIIPIVTFDGTAHQTCPGHYLTVTIRYDVPVSMPIVGIFTTTIPLAVSATSTILLSPTPGCP
jgi:Flp pilus assembly protein TadG